MTGTEPKILYNYLLLHHDMIILVYLAKYLGRKSVKPSDHCVLYLTALHVIIPIMLNRNIHIRTPDWQGTPVQVADVSSNSPGFNAYRPALSL